MPSDKKMLKVFDIMSYPVVTAREGEELKSVAEKMRRYGVGSVVVLNKEGKAVGIISQGDIVRRFASKKMKGTLYGLKAENVMSKPLRVIGEDDDINEAAKEMAEYGIKRLCVMDGKNKLVGIITDNDITKNASYLIDVLSEMVNAKGPGRVKEEEPEEFVLAEGESEESED